MNASIVGLHIFVRLRLAFSVGVGAAFFGPGMPAAVDSVIRSLCVIEVQHLTKRYGRVTAVDDVSFRVERGEILGFLGPNGAGKTTTMRILTGYMPATEGKAIVAGFDVFDQPIEAKRRTGYLPETPPLYPDMTRRRVPRRSSRRSRACRRPSGSERIKAVMERTRIADMADRALRQAVEGLPAARRPRAGAHPQPRRADPRRADRRPRSRSRSSRRAS